ncbi:MAG TPA: enoyl-CoA hydratase-related protein [Xanthobacteraceae bacterium]|nr:enoyl-CoA hydratase-related protein [Xanthobacteraceae bacterium]
MIETEDLNGVRVLRLAHGKASALDMELVSALAEACRRADRDAVRAVVLTGTGSIFCAGVDLFRIVDGGPPYVRRYLPAFADLMFALFSLEAPLVVAANGHAIAGGAVLLAAGDYRLMAQGEGRAGYTEHQVGVPFPPAALEVIRFGVPAHAVQDVLYGAETYPSETARALGLVDETVAPDRLLDRACAVAARYATPRRAAFILTKRLLRAETLARMRAAERQHAQAVTEAWCDPAVHETIRVYLARTVRRSALRT